MGAVQGGFVSLFKGATQSVDLARYDMMGRGLERRGQIRQDLPILGLTR